MRCEGAIKSGHRAFERGMTLVKGVVEKSDEHKLKGIRANAYQCQLRDDQKTAG
jgi:hypothetical protein